MFLSRCYLHLVRNAPSLDCTSERLYTNQPVVDGTHQLPSSGAFHLWVIHPEGYTTSLSGMSLGHLIFHRLCMSGRRAPYRMCKRECGGRALYRLRELCDGLSETYDNLCMKADCGMQGLVARHLCIGYWEGFSVALGVDVCVAK